jgi:hypothetical protein
VSAFGDALAIGLVVGAVAAVLSGLTRSIVSRGRDVPLGPALLDGALVGAVAVVVVGTMSPLGQFGDASVVGERINLVPFRRLYGAPPAYAVINLVLLVPLVLLLAHRWRRAGVVRLTAFGVATSLAIELAQLFHPARGTDVDDLILNSIGAAVAAVIGVVTRIVADRRRWRTASAARPGPRTPLESEVALGSDRVAVGTATPPFSPPPPPPPPR